MTKARIINKARLFVLGEVKPHFVLWKRHAYLTYPAAYICPYLVKREWSKHYKTIATGIIIYTNSCFNFSKLRTCAKEICLLLEKSLVFNDEKSFSAK